MKIEPLDAITLEVWWSRLVAIADEAATTLLRTAFSTIIRESNDYTVVPCPLRSTPPRTGPRGGPSAPSRTGSTDR